MAELIGAEILTTGNPDGRPSLGNGFEVSDLHGVASTFNALGLAGRVPLKFGHSDEQPMTDGQPALGWVSKVWVEGNKLLANFTDMPQIVFDAIKKGLYKFVSVELLRDVQAGNRKLPWVLDAVALLGADQPAFGNLKDLQSLTLSRTSLVFSERVSFSRKSLLENQSMSTEVELLTRQNRELVDALILEKFNAAIVGNRCTPAEYQRFQTVYKDKSPTLSDAMQWLQTTKVPEKFKNMHKELTHHGSNEGIADETPDKTWLRLRKEKMESHFKTWGEKITPEKANEMLCASSDPAIKEALRAYNKYSYRTVHEMY